MHGHSLGVTGIFGGACYRPCMKVKGTIRRTEVEGGHWVLHSDSGDQYQLMGKLEGIRDGMRAEVEGKLDKNQMGFGMVGAHFSVQKLTAL
jgi:hypothetical protein